MNVIWKIKNKELVMKYLTLIKEGKKHNVATDISGLTDNCAYIFNFFFNGDLNFVTNQIIKYYTKRKNNNFLFIEFSKGNIFGVKVYGVTVLKGILKDNKLYLSRCNKDKSFNTEKEALTYIDSLEV